MCFKNLREKIIALTLIFQNAIEQVFNQLLKPRIRPILIESYRDVSYVLDEQGYADAEYQDIFRKRFFRLWNDLVGEYHVSIQIIYILYVFFSLMFSILFVPFRNR